MDECLTDVCDVNANCTDTDGSYVCQCIAGYSGDGITCPGVLHQSLLHLRIHNNIFVFIL